MTPGADEAGGAVATAARVKRWLRPLLAVLAAAFVLKTAWDLAERWDGSSLRVHFGLAALATLPLVLSCFAQGVAWIALVEKMAHRRVARRGALSLYLASQLARYTPGKVGLPLVRMEGAPRIGLERGLAGISVLVEMVSWTATGTLLGLLLLAVTAPLDENSLIARASWPLVALCVAGTAALLSIDRRHFPAPVRRLVAPGGEGPVVPLRLPAAQLVYWALVALHGALLTVALGAEPSDALAASSFYVLASVAGFVVLAAPAGLGVREAVMVAGLTPSLGAAGALGAAIFSRALWLVAEVATWFVTRAWARGSGAESPSA